MSDGEKLGLFSIPESCVGGFRKGSDLGHGLHSHKNLNENIGRDAAHWG
jgi:hypothetical protein